MLARRGGAAVCQHRRMRSSRLAAFVPFVLLVGLLTACGSSGGTTAADGTTTTSAAASGTSTAAGATTTTAAPAKLTNLVKSGTLTVGTELPAPPFFVGDDYDKLTGGLEVDLSKEIAKRLGLSGATFVNMPFTGIVAGQKCACDLDFSQITINAERKAKVTFTTPYFTADQGVLVNKGTKVPDLATAKGLRWGAQATTTGFDKVKEITGKEPKAYDTVVAAFTALKAKQVDAVMLDVPIVAGEAGKPDSTFEVVGKIPTGEVYGGIVSDKANLTAIDEVITKLKSEGFLDALVAKYFPAAATVPELK